MQRLTAMTLGALAIGLAGFAFDAHAQTAPQECAQHEATIYFAPNSNALNAYSDYAIERMAAEARACGAIDIVVQTTAGRERARAVAVALEGRGLRPVVSTAPALIPIGDGIMARSVTLRVAPPMTAAG